MICAPITPTPITPHHYPHTYPHRELEGVRNATKSVVSNGGPTSLNLRTDFSDLVALVNYGITVQAVNDVGTGPPSTSVVFMPPQVLSE